MNNEKLREMLVATLQDARLSRGEKSALRQIFDHVAPTEQELSNYRRVAFEVARDGLQGTAPEAIVNWLEDVVRVIENRSSIDQSETEAWFSPDRECHSRIVRLIEQARFSAEICVFTITDDRISDTIIEAHDRGLPIRIITDDEKAFDAGSDIMRLERAGVEIRVDQTRYHMHHKFALFDRKLLLTGSYNWTRSADAYNEENFIILNDRSLIRSFSQLFDRLWNKFESSKKDA